MLNAIWLILAAGAIVWGALSGTLTANRVYWFSYRAYIRANPEPSNQPASATGSISLTFVPEPASALLLAGGLLALGLQRLRRV